MMFIGRTMVPRTVRRPRTSAVCSWRSFTGGLLVVERQGGRGESGKNTLDVNLCKVIRM